MGSLSNRQSGSVIAYADSMVNQIERIRYAGLGHRRRTRITPHLR